MPKFAAFLPHLIKLELTIYVVIYDVINNFQHSPGGAFEGGRATFPSKAP